MSDTNAVTTIPVSRTCEDKDCKQPAEVATVVTGEYGKDGIAVYCNSCAGDRDVSENHTPVGTVEVGPSSQQDE